MLVNYLELLNWLNNENFEEDYSIAKYFTKDDEYTPMKYRGIYENIGWADLWNDVGMCVATIPMYRPVGGGTVLYPIEG